MKTALVFGSSGLIGGHLLDQLIKNDNYNKIKLFVRSEIVAKAMIKIANENLGKTIFESDEIVEITSR